MQILVSNKEKIKQVYMMFYTPPQPKVTKLLSQLGFFEVKCA